MPFMRYWGLFGLWNMPKYNLHIDCLSMCEQCSDSLKCIKCIDPTKAGDLCEISVNICDTTNIPNDSSCSPCSTIYSGCLKCDSNGCVLCDQGYYINDGVCEGNLIISVPFNMRSMQWFQHVHLMQWDRKIRVWLLYWCRLHWRRKLFSKLFG